MFKPFIYRLGAKPKQSLKWFLRGLALFALAAGLIMCGYFYYPLLQVAGLVLLAIAIPLAAWGYLGIFANRFAQVISVTDSRDTNKDNVQ